MCSLFSTSAGSSVEGKTRTNGIPVICGSNKLQECVDSIAFKKKGPRILKNSDMDYEMAPSIQKRKKI